MAIPQVISVIQESQDIWTINVKDSKGNAQDLTGYTAAKLSLKDSSGTLVINLAAMTIANAVQGVCTYAPTSLQVSTVGEFTGDIQLTDGSGLLHRRGFFKVVISAKVA